MGNEYRYYDSVEDIDLPKSLNMRSEKCLYFVVGRVVAFGPKMDLEVLKHYSDLGVKGFKGGFHG